MTPLEMIAEWRRGCSNAYNGRPVECHQCTLGLIEALERKFRVEEIDHDIADALFQGVRNVKHGLSVQEIVAGVEQVQVGLDRLLEGVKSVVREKRRMIEEAAVDKTEMKTRPMDPSGLVDLADRVLKCRDAIAAARSLPEILQAMTLFDITYGDFARAAARASWAAQIDAISAIEEFAAGDTP